MTGDIELGTGSVIVRFRVHMDDTATGVLDRIQIQARRQKGNKERYIQREREGKNKNKTTGNATQKTQPTTHLIPNRDTAAPFTFFSSVRFVARLRHRQT